MQQITQRIPANGPTHHLRIRDLKVDPLRRQCTLRGEPIPLTGTEFAILSFLMENRGRVVPVRELSDAVWQDEVYVAREDCLAVHVKHIREKLHDRKPFVTVKTAWGKGYWVE
ncbi:MAG: winged helix-turn-helix transcriptional regulator [Oscillospiraceae bacterium]|nr:winged helix-turn-helix transcriptional regulator [Oscillospiraceae bacterium]